MHNLLSSCWKKLQGISSIRTHASRRRRTRAPLQVRALEPRWTPSGTPPHIYHVIDGTGLMAAVQDANTQSGTSEIILDTVGTYSLTAALNIHANIIITSANTAAPQSYVIAPSTGLQMRLITITQANSVTVEGVTLQGATAIGDGGAIDVPAAGAGLSLYQVVVQNNSATGRGGALFMADAAALNVVNAFFVDNTAGSHGGAVAFQAGSQPATVVVDHTTFRTNSAGGGGIGDGGAMFVGGIVPSGAPVGTLPPAVALTLTYTNFFNNTSTRNGGGLWTNDVANVAAGSLTVSGNTAVQSGGGLGNSISKLNSGAFALANSTISGNQVTGPGTAVTPEGGAASFDFNNPNASGTVTAYMANNHFSNNSVLGAGGGLFLRDQAGSTTFGATLIANTWSSNTASYNALGSDDGEGGGLYVGTSAANSNITSTQDTFSSNTADINGGGLYLADTGRGTALASLTGDSFTSNRAGSEHVTTGAGSDQGDGGGMMAEALVPVGSPAGTLPPGLRIILASTSLQNNSALNEGGGFWASDVTGLAAGSLTVTSNMSTQSAAGLGDSVSTLNGAAFVLANSTISGNQVNGSDLDTTPQGGGASFDFNNPNARGAVTANVANNHFANNTLLGAGGGLFLRDLAGSTSFAATFTGNAFSGNSAGFGGLGCDDGEGGGLYLETSAASNSITSTHDTFSSNTADINGGGWYLADTGRGTALASLNGDAFTSNRAGSGYADAGAGSDEGDGGGMMAEALIPDGAPAGTLPSALRVLLGNSSFQNNNAANEGGGFWASDVTGLAAGSLTISGNTSIQDAGGLGDRVCTLNYAAFVLAGSTISGNQVSGPGVDDTPAGGGVEFDFISENAAGTVTANVANNTFSRNSVTGGGGGLFVRDAANSTTFQATVTGNFASNNTASSTTVGTDSGRGGGFYIRASGASNGLNVSGNTFVTNGAATFGGGLYFRLDTGIATVNNNALGSNLASDSGAGMYLVGDISMGTGGNFNLSADTLANNRAATHGGGLYVDANVIAHLVSDSIIYNTAGTTGGGVFNNVGTVTLLDSIIMNNTAPTNPNFDGPYTDQGHNQIG